jgi:hypothetical protein
MWYAIYQSEEVSPVCEEEDDWKDEEWEDEEDYDEDEEDEE